MNLITLLLEKCMDCLETIFKTAFPNGVRGEYIDIVKDDKEKQCDKTDILS